MLATLAIAITAGVIGAYYYVAPGLPPAETIRQIPLQIPLRIYSRDGYLIEEVGERRRILISYEDLPQHVIDAFVAAEDRRFFIHSGVDYRGIVRAGLLLVKSGRISGGGSTLTQQLARDYFLTREQAYTRKLREAFLAYKIEQEFSKQEIMALFLNKMFFGQRAYGVAAAAQVYFGKPLQDINEAEAATLAGVLPAPSSYNPVRSPKNASMRRAYVLKRMHDLDFISDETFAAASAYPLESALHGTATELVAPYVAEMVRREMLERYGEETYSNGYQVVTTLDSKMQKAANYSLRNGLLEFTRRRGYRGPVAKANVDAEVLAAPFEDWPEELRLELRNYRAPAELSVAIVTSIDDERLLANVVLQDGRSVTIPWHGIEWANPYIDAESFGPKPKTVSQVMQPGDVIYVMPLTIGGYALIQLPRAQAAVVSVDPYDGAITSLAGGYDFAISKFNRVTQAVRQPGSSFKPFVYAAALSQGNTLATIVLDAPVVISSSALERLWRPINYSGRFYGEQRVREALVRSMNLASVRLLLDNTGIGNAVRYLQPFGFSDSALPRNGSLALGGGNATPLDMAQAYAVFANGGFAVTPYVIDSIRGADGKELYRADPRVVCRECEIKPKPKPLLPVVDHSDESALDGDPDPDLDAAYADTAVPANTPSDADPLAELFPGLVNESITAGDLAATSAQRLAQLSDTFRPDANVAPALFAGVNAAPRIITAQIAFLIQDAMRSVVRRGTGIRAWRAFGRTDLSGKTGTSNDGRDAWFAGFNSNIVSIVWVGFDDHTPLGPGEEGSRTALPIWIAYMERVIKGTPLKAMPMPEGIVSVRINENTGCQASSSDPLEDVTFEVFVEGTEPNCESVEELPDLFNSQFEEADEAPTDGDEEEEDPLF